MLFDWKGLFEATRLGWRRAPHTPLRVARFVALFLIYAPFCVMVHVGLALDDVLCRGYRKRTVERPIFIIANPRSGTTLLHRLMSLDEERFALFRTYQLAFPAVCQQRIIAGIAYVDARLGAPLAGVMRALDACIFRSFQDIHPTALDQPEEDEGLFAATFLSPMIFLLFPFIEQLEHLRFADRLPEALRRRLARHYDGCVKRRLHVAGGNRTLLSKNVTFAGRVESLLETYPDAQIVYLVRHPCEALPSLLSSVHRCWAYHTPEITKDSAEVHALAELGFDYYRRMHALATELPPERMITLRYEDLVRDPRATVQRIYERFGLEMSAGFEARLTAACDAARFHRSAHHYVLEDYGLSKPQVHEALPEIFETHGFTVHGLTQDARSSR